MNAIVGTVLAGGRSVRMGRDKAFVAFRGRPLVAHAIERLAPQVARLAISANGDPRRFAAFGHPVLPDTSPGCSGPLSGVLAGLAYARDNGFDAIVTAPCDAPFAPHDLAARLLAARPGGGAAVAASPRGVEPLFALWPVSAMAAIEEAAASDGAAWRVLERLGAARATIPIEAAEDWTLNLNSPPELAAAADLSAH